MIGLSTGKRIDYLKMIMTFIAPLYLILYIHADTQAGR